MKKVLRWFAVTLVSLTLLLLALAGGLWFYSGSDTSLASALRALTPLLGAGQRLELQDVSGSVRQGGRIGSVRWQHNGLQVHAQDITLRWQPEALFRREMRLTELTIGQLRMDDQRPATTDTPPVPPTQLGLPFKVDARIRINLLEWAGTTTQRVEQISFHYSFDNDLHKLDDGKANFSSNSYTYSGSLQASGPLALALQASGLVTAPVPGRAPLTVTARASLSGELAGRNAQLALTADLRPQEATRSNTDTQPAPPGKTLRARLSAQLAPWQSQPVLAAQAQWQALDLASLWSPAPHTRLSGNASVAPSGTGWKARAELSNTLSGPWNQQRLPIQALQAELEFTDGRWLLHTLQAQGAGGSVTATAQVSAQASWQMQGRLHNINPAAIDTRLDSTPLSGELSAHQSLASAATGDALANAAGQAALTFELDLQASANAATGGRNALQLLQLRHVAAQGIWAKPTLTLHTLKVEAQDAQLQGPLAFNTVSRAMQGRLDLRLPGLSAALNGKLSRPDGQGTLLLHLSDAAQASQWLSRWPQMAQALGQQRWYGSANLNAQWHGGWQNQANTLRVEGQLRSPQLGWSTGSATKAGVSDNDVTLRNLQLDLSGSPSHFSLGGHGQLATQGRQVDWQGQTVGERLGAGAWQARIDQLQLTLRNPPADDNWRFALETLATQPTQLTWHSGSGGGRWELSPGSAQVHGPLAGSASIRWQAMSWSAAAWQSQGQVEGLPLAWLDAFKRRSLSDLGLHTDMLLSGQWQASKAEALHASVTLERSQGDLFLQSGDGSRPTVVANMRETWLQANLDEGQLSASLRWDSARAGKALLAFSTRVQSASGNWSWNDDVPVAGSVQLQLPPMDVWSALAPPGWRLRGTVNTHINLGGTRKRPEWNGTLQARELALRSVVDGIDFSQGQLDATLHDQQLDLQTFTLRGANSGSGKADGGLLTLRGSLFWRPQTDAAALSQQIEMALQAELQSLRLSTRPDRRLVASGTLSADFKDGKLGLRGALSADQALFTLPDDSTPNLGDDVVVRQSGATPTPPVSPPAPAKRLAVDVALDLSLGPDFQVRGRGMATRLAGKLALTVNNGQPPQLKGTVRSVQGSYRAYGQKLDIERGLIRFTGAVDNPALDILAIRPKLTQRVGVQISGTALSPIVALYAEPDLPDAEKLAWLVLGRSASGGGAEAALMQQAALALLGGNGKNLSESMSSALGLDELSFRGSTDASTGTGTASAASVMLGKRLSSDFYLAYERSLNSAVGVFSIFYDLSRRLTLRAQTGEQSAVDLIYTLRYD